MKYYNTNIENFKLRETNKDDVGLILSFIKDIADYEKLLNEVVATQQSLMKSIFIEKRANVVIAELDGVAIGYALYFFNYSTFIGKAGLYLEDLYIKPEFRGAGFGREIFRFLGKTAKENGCKRMEWTCLDWNKSSIKFYESLGAVQMDEWTVHRLTEEEINKLASE
ncbi:MAG: GNAT family N-acetyltransferase [Clostridium sp.]